MADEEPTEDDDPIPADEALDQAADTPPIKGYSVPPDPDEEEQA